MLQNIGPQMIRLQNRCYELFVMMFVIKCISYDMCDTLVKEEITFLFIVVDYCRYCIVCIVLIVNSSTSAHIKLNTYMYKIQ